MFKYAFYIIGVLIFPISVFAQENVLNIILQNIENNNLELNSFQELIKSRVLEMNTENNLPDPVAGVFYLPWGVHNTGNYSEFQITQSFEFPTVYGARRDLLREKHQLLEFEYQKKREQVLLKAKNNILDVIYLNKLIQLEQERNTQAQQIYQQVQELFDQEQVGILELNKAKLSWLQEQFQVEQLKNEKQNLLLLLRNLNGGQKIEIIPDEYPEKLNLSSAEEIWKERLTADPYFISLRQQEQVAREQVNLARNKFLPDLTAGFNYQGVASSNYYGLFGGLTIPLWNNRNKVKAAETSLQYQQIFTNSHVTEAEAVFLKQYNSYQIMYKKLLEYRQAIEPLNSEKLLLTAYNLGEISFMEYYYELQFYRQAYNSMLKIENDLYQLKNEILKHHL